MSLRPLIDLLESISRLDRIEREAYEMGVELQLSDRGSYIALMWVKNRHGEPGAARVVLNVLNAYSDEVGKPIKLNVMDGTPELINYYKSLGFEVSGHPDEIDTEMTRAPK